MFPDSEYNGLRKIFDPSTDEDCSIFSSSLDGDDDVSCDGGLCMNLYGYQDFESNNLGDGVSVDVRDIGGIIFIFIFSSFVKPFFKKNCLTLPLIIDPNGQFGVFMHGNRINGRNESTRYRLIAGWIDREDNHANFGYMSYRQSGNIFSFFYFSCKKC